MVGTVKDLLWLVSGGQVEEALAVLETCGRSCYLNTVLHHKSGDSVLHELAKLESGHHVIRYLLEKSESQDVDKNIRNFDGKTPLHDSCQHGNLESVKLLIQHGALVNTLKKADWSPAMLAVTHPGRIEILKVLVESGADLTLVNKDGWTVFQVCCRTGDLEVLNFILETVPQAHQSVSKNGRTCLHTASLAGNTGVVHLLLKLGLDPNSGDSCGNTPMMDAVRSGSQDCLNLFIRNEKVDVSKRDKLGRDVVHVAAEAGQLQPLMALHQTGLSLESLTSSGQSPLHSAAREGQYSVVRYLVQQNVDIDHRDENGRSALFLAISGQHAVTAHILLQAGAKLVSDNSNIDVHSLARKQEIREVLERYRDVA